MGGLACEKTAWTGLPAEKTTRTGKDRVVGKPVHQKILPVQYYNFQILPDQMTGGQVSG